MKLQEILALVLVLRICSTFAQTTECNQAFVSNTGTFSTPKYPASVADKTMCEWNITIINGGSILLKLISELPAESNNCKSSLKIYDVTGGNKTLQHTFCNGRMQHPFVLMNYQMSVVYEASAADSLPIQMEFTNGTGCRGDVKTSGTSRTFQLPARPVYVGLETDCLWHVRARKGFIVRVGVSHFEIESTPDCNKGKLVLTDDTDLPKQLFETCKTGTYPEQTYKTEIVGVFLTLNTTEPVGMVISYSDEIQLQPNPPETSAVVTTFTTTTDKGEKLIQTPLMITVGMITTILILIY